MDSSSSEHDLNLTPGRERRRWRKKGLCIGGGGGERRARGGRDTVRGRRGEGGGPSV